ncbi:ATP-binding protein [Salsipaludibacter albus]|uniref:ATP-binding protein n=1 Tax=Salsipaludibacter albus TaxID=2849650 RepID=UPI001EE3B177|nr:winged helix-turn-helix domain-containing protein [Salsipaludibacter albus]MBY5164377.1 helix-turn-helix transcriptional regulator [Salsipaludibacter albus]
MATYRFDGGELDVGARVLRVDDVDVHVEPQVLDVLAHLLAHHDRMVSKEELLDAVWGNQFVTESALTSRIKSVRRALGDDGTAQRLIRTVRGHGYQFVGRVQSPTATGSGPAPSRGAPLPAERTTLVGRNADLAIVVRLVRTQRLVTVTGPGGMGKSSLGLAVARRWEAETARAQDHGDVAFAELAPARDLAGVVRTVAEATGVQGVASDDVAGLAGALAARTLLLVLDNCEHLVDDCADVVDALLDAGAAVRVLATSREPLMVAGEVVHPLGSLGAAGPELFRDRAVAATGRDVVGVDDPVVVELCDRLDGLPLAIELAAAQLRHLTLRELVARLDDRLRLLVGRRPRAGARHTTLESTIGWSHDLLDADVRTVFDRLGIFPADFDLAAVAAVTDTTDVVAMAAMAELVAKSLVDHDPTTGRYHLLETIRLFAASRLDESGQTAETTERLRRHVVARATVVPRPRAWSSGSLPAAQRVDLDNVRLAFEASLATGAVTDAVDIALSLAPVWRNAVSYAEGRRWVERLAAHDPAPRDRLWLDVIACDIGLGSGDPRWMQDRAEAALALADRADDPAGVVVARLYRALVMGDPEVAGPRLARAGAEAAEIGEEQLARLARAFLAVNTLVSGDRAGLAEELAELVTHTPTDGYDRYITWWAAWCTALADQDIQRLRAIQDVQVANLGRVGIGQNWLTVFCNAMTSIGEGEHHLAHLQRARRWAARQDRRADADCVLALAWSAARAGDAVGATELLGACEAELFHDTAGFVHLAVVREHVVRPSLDPADFARARTRGRERPLATILAEAGL